MTSDSLTRFKQMLAEDNRHITRSRVAVFELLNQNQPQAVRDLIKRSNGNVDRVSLYRNIALFEKLGVVHRVYIGWKYKLELTEYFIAHHHHLSCLGCSRVIDIVDEKNIGTTINQVAEKYKFKPVRHQFEIEGYCSACTS